MVSRIRWKTLPWLLGVSALAFSLVAARSLIQDNTPSGADRAPAKPATDKAVGLTVLGTVDVVDGIARVDAPAIQALSGLTIQQVLVKEGDLVKSGTPLVQFDDAPYLAKLAQAEAELVAAQWDVENAKQLKPDHDQKVRLQQLAVDAAKSDLKFAEEGLARGREVFERLLTADKNLGTGASLTEEDKDRRRRENLDLLKAEGMVAKLRFGVRKEEIDLERILAEQTEPMLQMAKAKMERLTNTVAEAKAILATLRLTAKTDGVIEQIHAVAGATFGPTSRTPLLYIVPQGKRIVRAEVDAEFANKIVDRVNSKVRICDAHNFSNTYDGVVKRISTSYLSKRSSADTLNLSTTKVLECLIEVTDSHPAGQPELLVGQPVRVVFGN